MIKFHQFFGLLVLCFFSSGCEKSDEVENLPNNELHQMAAKLPLEARYELYLRVYFGRRPSDPLLAEDIVKLGIPARKYVINKVLNAKENIEMQAALGVLIQFKEPCSQKEYNEILAAAARNDMEKYIPSYCKIGRKVGKKLLPFD